MNLFLAQKTNPSKSRLAKIFAIFLVCFFVGGVVNNVFAQNPETGTGSTGRYLDLITTRSEAAMSIYKDSNNITYAAISVENQDRLNPELKSLLTVLPFGSLYSLTGTALSTLNDAVFNDAVYVYKVSEDGTYTQISKDDYEKVSDTFTRLPVDPVLLNQTNGNWRYANGAYFYKDPETGQDSDPVDPPDVVLAMRGTAAAEASAGIQNQPGSTANQQAQVEKNKQTQLDTIAYNSSAGGKIDPTKATDMKCDLEQLDCWLAKLIYMMTIKPAGWLLAASGWLMDITFKITVVNLSGTLDGGFRQVIKLVWGMFRDIINMTFIFLLLYASIMTILKADTSRIKSMVGRVVIVAILINFSLFFATAIIDTSNVMAVGIYNQINQGNSEQNNNLAYAFLSKLKMSSLLTDATNTGGDYGKMMTISIFGSIFILVLAVMFFVISILFIIRFATLIMLMMMSPVGIAVIAIPKLEKSFGGGYWNNLISQCFFAPIMILFLWISIKMLDAIVLLGSPTGGLASTLSDANQAKAHLGSFILGFIVLIAILIKGIEFSKSLSEKGAGAIQSGMLKYSGADWMQNKMKNAPRNIGGAAAGGLARNTAGRVATRFADSEWGRNIQTTALGRLAVGGARGIADAKFGGKQGFAKNEADSIKQREKLRETLDKKSFAEQQAIEAQKERVRAESAKELEHVTAEGEASDVHKANQALVTHTNDKTNLEEKKRVAEEVLKQQKDYLADPATQANASYKKAAEESVKKATEELEKVDSEIEKLDETLVKAFKSAKIEIDPKDLASITNAKTALDAKNADLATKAGLAATANSKDVAKAYSKMAEKQKAATETERVGLKAVEDAIKAQSKARQEQYAKSLSSRGLNNLFIPSRGARQAAMNVRREANKTSDEKEKDEMNRLMKKLLAEKEKEGGGDKSKDDKK